MFLEAKQKQIDVLSDVRAKGEEGTLPLQAFGK
jgi:hypothetical protein